MNALENFKHAETFASMPLSEKIIATGYVILLGMGITFLALVLIWALTALMSKIIRSIENKSEISKVKGNVANGKAVETSKLSQSVVVPATQTGDLELVAVITAAIAAAMDTSVSNIHVSSIKRINDTTPTWGRAGRSELMNTRV
ncbi:OadG family protein [Fusibacter bizertensis]